MSIFREKDFKSNLKLVPLAYRMRPINLDELVGQDSVIGKGTALRQAIESDRLFSCIFYGPAGVGKSSLAQLIAKISKAAWIQLSAVTAGVADIKKVIQQAKERLEINQKQTVLFLDEIHRFNKAQQDVLLPAVEEGTIILIGATTENPYFELNPPLISRCRIIEFKALSKEDLKIIALRALKDKDRGLGGLNLKIEKEALDYLSQAAEGDARVVLDVLESAAQIVKASHEKDIGVEVIKKALQKKVVHYGKDEHYDMISAFIKSLRGSDPDAALYWLARMLEAGEDPRFIARRMVVAASEDIGLADSRALEVTVAAAQAVEFVGLPEARINLAHAAIYLATAPKSNSVIKAIDKAVEAAKTSTEQVPQHLRDSHYLGAKKLGRGLGYKYPHNYPGHYIKQQYLPEKLKEVSFYIPTKQGQEKEIYDRLIRKK
jgi:putative ATPase